MSDSIWTKKGATFSDKSACKEFGFPHEEIINLIKTDKLQYRINNMHGNPYFRLIRSELEAYINDKFGKDYLRNKKLRKLKKELKSLEHRKIELLEDMNY